MALWKRAHIGTDTQSGLADTHATGNGAEVRERGHPAQLHAGAAAAGAAVTRAGAGVRTGCATVPPAPFTTPW